MPLTVCVLSENISVVVHLQHVSVSSLFGKLVIKDVSTQTLSRLITVLLKQCLCIGLIPQLEEKHETRSEMKCHDI